MPDKEAKKSSMKNVTALERGLDILLLLNRQGPSHIRDLHKISGLPKPTIVRMLATLNGAGYVSQSEDGTYRVTAKTLALSIGFDAADHLLAVAKPVLAEFREENAWPADLAIFDRDAMVIMDTSKVPGTLSLNRGVGSRLPVMPTALGRAYLAFCPDDQRQEIIDRLAQSGHADEGLARDRGRLDGILEKARQQGYATSDQEFQKTARVISVPVFDGGILAGCVNMMTVSAAMTLQQAEFSFVPLLKDLAQQIAAKLDGTGAF